MFSVCRKPGGDKKDTWANVEATGEFVVCMMSEWFINAANHTCGGAGLAVQLESSLPIA
jgi:flavin reductase (DIM6/NTAB) family NADH-FMN oxidoreductase RutF